MKPNGLHELVQRFQGMFLEVPGTRLSVDQAARLEGVDPAICRQVLESLTEREFLKSSRGDTFMLR
jgi:DNA-binding IscR family transcriptional regulator